MKTVSSWDHLRPYGIVALTGEACSLMYRILCDLTQHGKQIVERCLSVQIQSESWNCSSEAEECARILDIVTTQCSPAG
jgi:hypothetical protein